MPIFTVLSRPWQMPTNIMTVKSILSRPLNELLGVLNLEQYNGLERRQYGLEGTHILSKSIALSNIRLLPGPPHPPTMTVHRYGMGETNRIVRLGSGPGGRHNITSHLETDMNVVKDVKSGFLVPNIPQILKRVMERIWLGGGVYNHAGTEVLSGPPHPQKDTVCAFDKVGQSNSLKRKEIKQNEGDKSVNSVLSEPPHPPKETTSNYDQKDHSNSLDSETLVCRSVTVPCNTKIVSS